MEVQGWLQRARERRPDATALVADGAAPSYAELAARVDAAARDLHARGARAGDRVAIALPPGLGFAVALHATLRLGAVAVPVDLRLGKEERAQRAATCAVTVDGALEDGPPAPLRDTHDLAAVAAVIHTSGTTGTGRPIELTYGNWLWSALGSAVALGLDAEERWLSALPLAHVGGLSILLRSSIYGTTAVVHPAFDLDAALAELATRATLVSLVPTQLSRLLDAGLARPPRLRAVLLGGGPIPPVLLERAREAQVPVVSTYGLTEACSQVTTGGFPLFCTRVELSPESEILVRGPTVSPTAGEPLRTGDLGAFEPDGSLRITGRAADTIVTGGENVAPAEVEAVLEEHPAVAEAGVFALPDGEWGEAVVATVVLAPGAAATEAELRAHVRARLAGFKVPKRVAFAASLPRTPSGKLLRRLLA